MRFVLPASHWTCVRRTRDVWGKNALSALSMHVASCAQEDLATRGDASAQTKDSVPGSLTPLEDERLESIEPHPDGCGSITHDLKSMA